MFTSNSSYVAIHPRLFSAPTGTTLDLSKDPGLAPALREGKSVSELTHQGEPADRSSQFVAVTGSEAEHTNATTLVVAAYGLFWLFTFVLVWVTFQGQKRLQSRMGDLERRLSEDTGRGVNSP